ncbi:MAG: bacteriorhodopsin-like [Bacteroidetes bacterium]|nr:bacteriorhodopsin-like [Rhodothermia bacterium]MCS7154780.1 bacteriorhodopsin-like [Bacteroidota bacterium]MCX7907063.1 bacteriorhodopsin-like [Bacteroidota bacterium]MDW8137573.1 bacteriorhodopsin [Bacteroidota bacterium]MDW8285473.1 bacteriorhodopsin [Bacteroidota bacterium]
MRTLPELTYGQYWLVFNVISLTIAGMLAAFVYFILSRERVNQRYRIALYLSAVIVLVAAYHYLRIWESWTGAFQLVDGRYIPTGKPFNDFYRYADWLVTVPLLLVELILVLGLPKNRTQSLSIRLVFAAILMLGLGYVGEVSRDVATRNLWGTLSSIPFVYILYVLWIELSRVVKEAKYSDQVNILLRNTRLLLLASWGFYPIAYVLGSWLPGGATQEVAVQVGYSIADILAKPIYGIMVYAIARAKSLEEGLETAPIPRAA